MEGRPDSRVAVLMTCYNRRDSTLASLEALFEGRASDLELQVFLVDDGSTDGTSEAVRQQYPEVQIERGDGTLFWGGGMRRAFAAAEQASGGFDFHLWLNDDTFLEPGAIARLIETHRRLTAGDPGSGIVVGTTRQPKTSKTSYGGLVRLWPLPLFRSVTPATRPKRCTTMNGNVVLVPRVVIDGVGNIDEAFTHLRGDLDYGLRARSLGYSCYVAPGFFGVCEGHPVGEWRQRKVDWREGRDLMQEPKYALEEKVFFAKRHFGVFWPLAPLFAHLSLAMSSRRREGR